MPPCVHRAPPHSAPHPRRRSGRRRRRPLAPPAHLRLEQPARRPLARLPPARLAPSLHSAGLALARVARLEPPARRHLEQQARPRLVRHRRLVSDLNKPLGSWGLDLVLLACLHWQPSSQGTLCPTAKLCPACTPVLAAFGATPAFGGSPGFGASAPAFGATSTPAFGASATPAFGQPLTAFGSTTFGGAATAAGVASSGRACLLPAHASSAPPPADLPCRKLPPPTTAGCMPGADPACCLRLHPGPRPAGGFGGPGFGGGARGTRQVAYRKTQEQDTSGSSGAKTIVFFNSISCMQEYVGKSAEELRWEDYQVCGRVWPVYRRMRVCVWCEVVRAGVQEHTCGERRRDPRWLKMAGPDPASVLAGCRMGARATPAPPRPGAAPLGPPPLAPRPARRLERPAAAPRLAPPRPPLGRHQVRMSPGNAAACMCRVPVTAVVCLLHGWGFMPRPRHRLPPRCAAPAFGAFGAASTPAFGAAASAPAFGGFGAAGSSPFGAASPSPFGQTGEHVTNAVGTCVLWATRCRQLPCVLHTLHRCLTAAWPLVLQHPPLEPPARPPLEPPARPPLEPPARLPLARPAALLPLVSVGSRPLHCCNKQEGATVLPTREGATVLRGRQCRSLTASFAPWLRCRRLWCGIGTCLWLNAHACIWGSQHACFWIWCRKHARIWSSFGTRLWRHVSACLWVWCRQHAAGLWCRLCPSLWRFERQPVWSQQRPGVWRHLAVWWHAAGQRRACCT